MTDFLYANGATSLKLRVFIPDATSVIGGGKTGLLFSSTGLIIATMADNEAAATPYTQAGGTIETITTLGTFAAPTATKCRFKEVDASYFPGLYELQIADARWAVGGATYVDICLPPVSGLGTALVRRRVWLKISVAELLSGVISAGSIAADAITAGKIAADAIGASELAADAVTEIANAVAAAATASPFTVDVTKIAGSAAAATNLKAGALSNNPGTVASGTLTTTQFTSNLAGTNDSDYLLRQLTFAGDTTTVALRGIAVWVTGYNGSTKAVTVAPALPVAPVNGDTFVIS